MHTMRPPAPHVTSVEHSARLLRVPEVAQLLGLSRSKTYQLIASGALKVVRIDRSTRIRESALLAFVEERAATSHHME